MAYFYALLSLLAGWFGSATGSYFNKRAENLATKQDIAEITERTKSIEAKISNEMWVGQRNWQAKRDAAFELVRELGSFQESAVNVFAAAQGFRTAQPHERTKAEERLLAVFNQYTKRTSDLWRAKMVFELFFDEPIISKVWDLEGKARNITQPNAVTPEGLKNLIPEMAAESKELLRLVREELLKP